MDRMGRRVEVPTRGTKDGANSEVPKSEVRSANETRQDDKAKKIGFELRKVRALLHSVRKVASKDESN